MRRVSNCARRGLPYEEGGACSHNFTEGQRSEILDSSPLTPPLEIHMGSRVHTLNGSSRSALVQAADFLKKLEHRREFSEGELQTDPNADSTLFLASPPMSPPRGTATKFPQPCTP